ncbi:MAG: LCP family protein [Solibacillus sp.]
MEDKQLWDKLHQSSEQQLSFTKEDRQNVFEQIRKLDDAIPKKVYTVPKKMVPLTVSLFVVGLCLFLFLPSMLQGDGHEGANPNELTKEPLIPAAKPVVEEDGFVTSLITVKSEEMDNGVYLNLLFTYNQAKKAMKVISLSHLTYAPVAENRDGTTLYDKLLVAYRFGGAENVKATVSKLVDLPIDYYAVIDLKTFSELIDSVGGIEYDVQQDIRARAITQVAFDFEQGTHRFSGEEVVALMMATAEGNQLDENDLLNLINRIVTQVESEISSTQLKQLFSQLEANVSFDQLVANQTNINVNSLKSISLIEGMITTSEAISSTERKFYYKLDGEFLDAVLEELTTFD